jgi:hypothetical protein
MSTSTAGSKLMIPSSIGASEKKRLDWKHFVAIKKK